MDYVDFHTHLDWYERKDDLLNQLKQFEGTIVAASVDAESYKKNVKIAAAVQNLNSSCKVIPTVGIHPENAEKALENLSIYDDLCNESLLIGEIGMDFCWCKDVSPVSQEKVFRYFLEHCNKTGKYCVIHTKDAEVQIARILEEYPNARPIIHWYDGPEDVFQEFCRRGYYQTFGCETIRSKYIHKLLKQTPEHLILTETDNPTAEPWLGGTDSSVMLIKRIYTDIGIILGINEFEVGKKIAENSNRILGCL